MRTARAHSVRIRGIRPLRVGFSSFILDPKPSSVNLFAGSEGILFKGSDGIYFAGRNVAKRLR